MNTKPTITHKTRIRELIDAYPDLEDELVAMAPAFAKLTNPVLRNTVARVTTISQAALIGDMDINEMVNRLRQLAGQEAIEPEAPDKVAFTDHATHWFNPDRIRASIDARPMLEAGQHPMELVFSKLAELNNNEILELINAFIPAPLISGAEKKGFQVYVKQADKDKFITWFCKV